MPKSKKKVQEWTDVRFWQFVRSNLRSAPYPPKFAALTKARREYIAPPDSPKKKGGKQKWEYQCADCRVWFPNSKVAIDHIIPCGELSCYDHLVPFCKRLWCPLEGFQVLCDDCHGIKTYMEIRHVSKEFAIARIDVIRFLKQPVGLQKEFLVAHGIAPKDVSNKDNRELSYIKLKESGKNESVNVG